MIKAVTYIRRSTKTQDASIKDQRTVLAEYAKKHDYQVIREYLDDGISGDEAEKRPGFMAMHQAAMEGGFQVILCWDQERFGRWSPHEASYWTFPLAKAGVRLVTVDKGPIEWNEFVEWLTYSVNQHAKHEFLKDLSRNVLRGQIEAAKTGSWSGAVPFGYRLEGPKKARMLVLGPLNERRLIKRLFKEFVDERRALCDIARRLNEEAVQSPGRKGKPWRFDTVKFILANPVYTGTFRWGRSNRSRFHHVANGQLTKGGKTGRNGEDCIVIPNHHEAIIGQVIFDRAQAILERGRTGRSHYTPEENPYLLSGLLRCGRCGGMLKGLKESATTRYYECTTREYHGPQECQGTTVREDAVLDYLVQFIETEIMDHSLTMELWKKAKSGQLTEADLPQPFQKVRRMLLGKSPAKSSVVRIQKDIKRLNEQIAKAVGNLSLADPEFLSGIQKDIRKWQEEKATLETELKNQPSEEEVNATVLSVLRQVCLLGTLEKDRLKPVLKEIDHITCYTSRTGNGTGTRHRFIEGEVNFRVGPTTGKVNPCLSLERAMS